MAALPLIMKVVAVAGTALSAAGQYQQGRAADASAQFEAAQLNQQADLTAQEGLRRAEEQRRQKRIAMSDARAAAAAGGGDTAGAGELSQIGQLGAAFERNALEEVYGANMTAGQQRLQAAGVRAGGKIARRAGTTAAVSTILSGVSSIYGGGSKPATVPKTTSYGAGAPTSRTVRRAYP